MSMQIDTAKLGMFRNVQFGNDNAIANLSGSKTSLVHNNEVSGNFFGKMFRAKATEAQNNAARTELLKTLGQAFGLSGMTESDGTTRFSEGFIKKLEDILGRDVLKTGDFKIKPDGTVSSGRPLTQRRINAIVNKAVLFSPGTYNFADYKMKLDYVKSRLSAMPNENAKSVADKFEKVEKMMNFVKDEVPRLIDDNPEYELSDGKRGEPFALRKFENGIPRKKELVSLTMVNEYVSERIGMPFHLAENIIDGKAYGARLSDVEDPKTQIPAYFERVMTSYATTAIDLFIECEKRGKLEEFFTAITSFAICTEAKTAALIDFKLTALPMDSDGPVATHNNDQPLHECIGREMTAMVEKDQNLTDSDDFKDFAAQIKKNLDGTIRPITEPYQTPNGIKFRPVLDGEGKPVVRAITEEDIDRLGQACIDASNGL